MVGAGKGKPRGLWDPTEDTQPGRSGRASWRRRWLSKDLKVEQESARATEGGKVLQAEGRTSAKGRQ